MIPGFNLARSLLTLFLTTTCTQAAVTIYTQIGNATSTASGAAAAYTGSAAYDPTTLIPPTPPNPPPAGTFGLQLISGGMPGLSIPHNGGFMGFSIELSVANQVFGRNSQHIEVPFLNLMANLKSRGGSVTIRLGGNTQEKAVLHTDPLPGNALITKEFSTDFNNPSPVVSYSLDLIYALSNISSLTNVQWILGYPFANINPPVNDLVQYSTQILGGHLLGVQVGNEPDRYSTTKNRGLDYNQQGYFNDFGTVMQSLEANPAIGRKSNYIGGSVCCNWTPDSIWDTGFIEAYNTQLGALAVEHYPEDNCQFNPDHSRVKNPQDNFELYLSHQVSLDFTKPYAQTIQRAQAAGKPLYLLETNTASCSGFRGISNSFGAVLWGIDHGLNLAAHNFTGGNFHVGGQDAFYNPFTAPPTNQSTFRKWTVGSVYYSAMVLAETFGPSNNSQVVDLGANNGNIYTPAYAIYENGQPTKVAIFNFITDPSGAHDSTVNIWVGGSGVNQPNASPPQLKVKRMSTPHQTVADIQGFFWANQTFGDNFQSDGRLMGDKVVETIPCDVGSNTCTVKVPAPGFALVFLSDQALADSEPTPEEEASMTFATSAFTKLFNTATIDQAVLTTSNGRGGLLRGLGSTSMGSVSNATPLTVVLPGLATLLSFVAGAMIVVRSISR